MKEKLKHAVEVEFLELLRRIFGSNLASVVAYGSYASGNFVPGVSDVNVLITLDESEPRQLEDLGKKGGRLMRRAGITPLVLTKTEFLSSADVFPMEYMDIQAHHMVLLGEDITGTVTLSKVNLRHQLEDRLRGLVASLRKILVSARGREKLLGRYLKLWLGPYGALFRGLLRLKGAATVPREIESLLVKVKEMFGIDTAPFVELEGFRRGKKVGTKKLAFAVLSSLEQLIKAIDRIEV